MKLREKIKMKKCKYCHSKKNLTVDHKISQIHGGSSEAKNLQTLCKKCNMMKSGFDDNQIRNLWKWFIEIQNSRKEKGKKLMYENLINSSPLTVSAIMLVYTYIG